MKTKETPYSPQALFKLPKIAEHINEVLTEGILKAYEAGIKAVVDKNLKTVLATGKEPAFNKYDDDFQVTGKTDKTKNKTIFDSPFFSIDYTSSDQRALRNFRLEAFTVATIGEYDLEEQMKLLAIDTIENRQGDINYFQTIARRLADRYIRGDWLQTNLLTATSSSYRAAEWNRLQDETVVDTYPAYQYKTRNDSRVRDEHRKLEGKVFRSKDPIWKSIWPPNGWNCRCYTIPLDQNEVTSGQYKIENDLRTEQETKDILKEAFPNPKDAKNFMRNPGETDSIWKKWIDEKLKGFTPQIRAEIKKKIKEYKTSDSFRNKSAA